MDTIEWKERFDRLKPNEYTRPRQRDKLRDALLAFKEPDADEEDE